MRLFPALLLSLAPLTAQPVQVYSRALGGSLASGVIATATDSQGNVIAVGATQSYDLPTVNAFQPKVPATQIAVSTDSGATFRNLSSLPADNAVALAVDPSNPAVLYARGTNALYKSTDGGASWSAVRNVPIASNVSAFAIDSRQTSRLYLAQSDHYEKSEDGGATWTTIYTVPPGTGNADAIAADPFHPSRVFADDHGPMRSDDAGAHWTRLTLPLQPGARGWPVQFAFDAATPDLVYAMAPAVTDATNAVLRSTDGGLSWTLLHPPLFVINLIAADPKAPGAICLNSSGVVFKSADRGDTWTRLGPDYAGFSRLVIDPSDSNHIIAGTEQTLDGGVTWIGTPEPVGSLAFDPTTPRRVYVVREPRWHVFVTKLSPSGETIFSTYLGGTSNDYARGVAVDPAGNIFVAGTTYSADLPVSTFAAQPRLAGGVDGFVAKFAPDGSLVYSTYLGGSDFDVLTGIAADRAGHAGVAGYTLSPEKPGKMFAAQLSPDGSSFDYWTSLGGSGPDNPYTAAYDSAGRLIVGGIFQFRPYLARVNADGSLDYLSQFGPAGAHKLSGLAVDDVGNVYVTGSTDRPDFPITPGAYQSKLGDGCPWAEGLAGGFPIGVPIYHYDDLFVTKFDPAGGMVYSTLIGGNCWERSAGLALNPDGSVWISGYTDSTTFPQVDPIDAPPPRVAAKSVLAKLSADGSQLLFSTFVDSGGTPALSLDGNANVFVSGYSDGVHAVVRKIAPK